MSYTEKARALRPYIEKAATNLTYDMIIDSNN